MSSRRSVSWNAISRSLHDSRPVIPAGLLSARAQVQFSARRHPLFVAGRFDMSAIMATAAVAATGTQARLGLSRSEAMSTALKAAWQAAKMARTAVAH